MPLLTILLLLTAGKQPLLGWGTIWQWLVMTAGGAVATPFVFALFDWSEPRPRLSAAGGTQFPSRPGNPEGTFVVMLIFDELKRNDPQLRLLAVVLTGGLFVLLAGLWWVQVVSASKYESHLETQSYRTVRIPAVRGKILDRNGRVLAENRPSYNLSLYLDDLRQPFFLAYSNYLKSRTHVSQQQGIAAQEKKLGRSLTKAERKQFALKPEQLSQLHEQSRYRVAAGVVEQVAEWLGQPLPFDEAKFDRHYETRLALPYPVLPNNSLTRRWRVLRSNIPAASVSIWTCSPCARIPTARWRRICSDMFCAMTGPRKARMPTTLILLPARL